MESTEYIISKIGKLSTVTEANRKCKKYKKMDEFFKRIAKKEPYLKNFEVEITPTPHAAPAPSSTPDVTDTTEKSNPIAEQAQLVKEDARYTSVHIVDSEAKQTKEYGFAFFTEKEDEQEVENFIEEMQEEPKVETVIPVTLEEPKLETEPPSNELVKMLEQAGETTDFLS